MAIIFCSECGSEVSDKAINCIKCGNPIRKPIENKEVVLDFKNIDENYADEFLKIHNSQGKYKGKFNGYAFFFSTIWFFVKGCWATGLSYIIISIISAIFIEEYAKFIQIGLCVNAAVRANYILYNKKVLNKNIWL
jgi:hypothetical protein